MASKNEGEATAMLGHADTLLVQGQQLAAECVANNVAMHAVEANALRRIRWTKYH